MDTQTFLRLLLAQQQQKQQPLVVQQPAASVFAPPATLPPAVGPFGPNPALIAPRRPDESLLAYGPRALYELPSRAIQIGVEDTAKGIRELGRLYTETPRQQQAREADSKPKPAAGQAGTAFPKSFRDPVYDSADAYAAKLTGVPQELISRIRLLGERSNAGQVSAAGANTPYQITPETRQGIIKNYGIDPWSSPQNAALGAAYVLREQGGSPKPGAWTNENMMRAVGGYFGGAAGAANPFSMATDANGQTIAGYVGRVIGSQMVNPFDPTYDEMALGQIGAERQALMTPFSASMNIGPAPELPEPEKLPTTDFTAADQALQAMRPIEMSEKEKLRRERTGWFQGLAQAMMQSSGNEGLGTFLMRLGGASLAGRMKAKDEIEQEMDKFEDKMAAFNAAVYRNELGKAEVHGREALAQVQQNNQYNRDKWTTAYQRWLGSGSIDISGTNAVLTRKDPSTGQIDVRTIPIPGAVDAAIAQQTANLFSTMSGRQMAGNQQITGMTNAIIGRLSIQEMQRGAGSQESDAAAAAAPAFYGTYIAQNGLVGDLLGPDAAKDLEKTVQKSLMGMGLVPGSKEWLDRRDRLVAIELTKLGLADPKIMQQMIQVGGTAGSFEALDAVQSRKVRTSTDAKGQTTTSTTMNAADVFDSDAFNDQLASAGYVRR